MRSKKVNFLCYLSLIKYTVISQLLCLAIGYFILPVLLWYFWGLKAELNPKAATLDLYDYLVPCLVLDNIPKYKKSQSNHFLTTPTYIHTGGIADPWADWAMISNRPGNNKKRRQLTIACNGIKFSFPRFIWFCWAAIFFYFHQVLSVLWWLETLDTSGYVWALEKVSFELISPTYMFKGLSSALRYVTYSLAHDSWWKFKHIEMNMKYC